MKIAIISDIHANFVALDAVYNYLKREGVCQIYALGDLVGYYPQIDEVIDFIIEKNIITIMGNYDKACLCKDEKEGILYLKKDLPEDRRRVFLWTRKRLSDKVRDFLSGLPQKIELHFDKRKMLLVHGSPTGIANYIYPNTSTFYLESLLSENMVDIIVCGHTHQSMILGTREGYVLNPGSVGVPDNSENTASCLIIELSKEPFFEIKKVPYDREFADLLAKKFIYSTFDSEKLS